MTRYFWIISTSIVGCFFLGCGGAAPGSSDTSATSRSAGRQVADSGGTDLVDCDSDDDSCTPRDEDTRPNGRETAGTPANNEVVDATFDDLNCNIQQDIVFRPWMITERASELNGRRVRIAGYMLPDLKQTGIKEFVLLKNTQCKFGPGGQADHLIRITLKDGVSASYQGDIPLQVVGRLVINPFEGLDGNTWSIYDMEGESVKRYRR